MKQVQRVEKSKRRTTITLSSTVLLRKDSDNITGAARDRLARVAGDLRGRARARYGSPATPMILAPQRTARI